MYLCLFIVGWLSFTAAPPQKPPHVRSVWSGQHPCDANYGEFAAIRPEHIGVAHTTAAISREILFYVNEFRRSKGLPALEANSFISSVALGHSRDMLTGKSPFGHDGFRQRIDRISGRLGKLHVAAENVASGPMDAREVVDGWLHSPGHRRNIMGDFRLTGIGVAEKANGMIYFTQIFVR